MSVRYSLTFVLKLLKLCSCPYATIQLKQKALTLNLIWTGQEGRHFKFHLPGTTESHQFTYNVSVKCTKFRHSKRCNGWDKGRETFVPPVYSSALGKKERKGEEEEKKEKVNCSTCRTKNPDTNNVNYPYCTADIPLSSIRLTSWCSPHLSTADSTSSSPACCHKETPHHIIM